MFGLTTRGQLDPATQLEFERLYARLTEFLSVSFTEDGELITPAPSGVVPVGGMMDWGTTTPPDKWLILDGTPLDRVTYKGLFEIWGTTHGVGNGTTTFGTPDTRGRFILYKSAAGTGSLIGETGGSLDHTHAIGAHTHTVSVSGTSGSGGGFSTSTGSAGGHNHSYSGTTTYDTTSPQLRDVNLDADYSATPCEPHVHDYSGTTSTSSDHSHTMSISDHSHSVDISGTTGSSATGNTGTSNPAYVVFCKIVYTGVST